MSSPVAEWAKIGPPVRLGTFVMDVSLTPSIVPVIRWSQPPVVTPPPDAQDAQIQQLMIAQALTYDAVQQLHARLDRWTVGYWYRRLARGVVALMARFKETS